MNSAADDAVRDTLERYGSQAISPEIALMRLAELASTPHELDAVVISYRGPGAGPLLRLHRTCSDCWRLVHAVLRVARPGFESHAANADERLLRIAESFDAAVAISPEASVALFSMGNAQRLDAATEEIARALSGWGLLGASARVLDIGCGIGRIEAALARNVRSIVGLDISHAMIAHAKERCSHFQNVSFRVSSGRSLEGVGDETVDLVLAVDTLPYVVQAGDSLVETFFAEARRVLTGGGAFVILNFSYRGDFERDMRQVKDLGEAHGFQPVRCASRDFRIWDGSTFHLTKRA